MSRTSKTEMEDWSKVLSTLVEDEGKAALHNNSTQWLPGAFAKEVARSLSSLDSLPASENNDVHVSDDDSGGTLNQFDPLYSAADPSKNKEEETQEENEDKESDNEEDKENNDNSDENSEEDNTSDKEEDRESVDSDTMRRSPAPPPPKKPQRARPLRDEVQPAPDYGSSTKANGPVRQPSVRFSSSIKPDYDDDSDDAADPEPDYGVNSPTETPDFGNDILNSNHVKLKPTIQQLQPTGKGPKPRGGVQIFPNSDINGDIRSSTRGMSSLQPPTGGSSSALGSSNGSWKSKDDHVYDSDPLRVADLAKLPELTLKTITDCIEKRYQHDLIYTRCGEILISVNPFKILDLCSSKYHENYTFSHISDEPHLFAVSAKAYQQVRSLQQNQVILVSGESGAGKTEATKYMVQHLMALGGSDYLTLQDKIIKVNPLLEAFGNAKTSLNNNSSRFAKFLELRINSAGKIESARIKDYMLEKSRVVHHGRRERTFHSFYALLVGASDQELENLYIKRGEKFRITGDFTVPSEKERMLYGSIYDEMQSVFKLVKLLEEEIQDINTILAAVLHIGNIQFEDSDNDSVVISNESCVQKVAQLLNIDVEKLTRVLIERKGKVGKDDDTVNLLDIGVAGGAVDSVAFSATSRGAKVKSYDLKQDEGEIIELSKNKKQAEDERDAVAKTLYERMFGWLVRKVNEALKSNFHAPLPNIGILDICGFENLDENSFEQLCINLVNERLQNFMNKQVIETERELYLLEGVEISEVDIEGINNDAIIKMFFEERTGILAMIDEDSKLEFSNDERLVNKLSQQFRDGGIYVPSIRNTPDFVIRHFAGEVSYDANNFIKKNRDTLSDDMLNCLKSSESLLIQDLFTVQEHETGTISMTAYQFRGSRKPSMNMRRPITESNFSQSINKSRSSFMRKKMSETSHNLRNGDMARRNTHIKFFQNSMKELLDAMSEAHSFFVRCIKPNDRLRPAEFVKERVRIQLQYNGVTEVARIRTFGYPYRFSKGDFEKMYGELARQEFGRDPCYNIFSAVRAENSQYKIGKTQVFLKESAKKTLDNALTQLRIEQERREKERREKEERERRERERIEEEERELKQRERELQAKAKKLKEEIGRSVPAQAIFPDLDPITELSTPSTDEIYNQVASTNMTSNSEEETESSDTEVKELLNSPEEPEEEKLQAAWDITQELTEEEERRDVHEQPVLMVLKVIVYLILFLIVLGSFVIQKVGFLLLLTNLKKIDPIYPTDDQDTQREKRTMKDVQTVSYVLLEIAICVPYAVSWIITVGKLCFGNFKRPSSWTWLWVFIMENLHTLGICLLVFRVLPRLDVIRAAMLLTASAILPSMLKVFMANENFDVKGVLTCCNKYNNAKIVFRHVFNVLAMLGQITVIPLLLLNDYMPEDDTIHTDSWRMAECASAFFLISFSHWENYMDGRFLCNLGDKNFFKNAALKIRYELQRGRHYPYVIAYPWKIGLTVLLGYILSGDISFEYANAFDKLSRIGEELKSVSPILAITLAGFVAFYVSFGACMFQMQIFCLAIPALLATPATIGFLYLDCEYDFLSAVSTTDVSCDYELFGTEWINLVFGVVWLLSLLVVARHLWKPQVDRTANMARIFLNPHYCGILTAESIMLNRRRHPGKVGDDTVLDDSGNVKAKYYKLLGTKKFFADDYDGSDDENDGDDVEMPREHIQTQEEHPTTPMLYACATMWHETRTEMVQLLKSLHRLDRDQYIRRVANENLKGFDPEFYNFEAHILFDDAMELDDNNERVPNRWVKELVACMDVACSSVHGKPMKVHPPTKVPTPYGGQLIWQMPGENLLFVHMKDMSKIRNRKRWSQVMYMYYLLGYRHIMNCKNELLEKMRMINKNRGNHGLNITEINYLLGEAAAARSQNTFLLALDGDTDFSPGSIKILLDRMKDENVGAACGRIHPIGNGPMVWYQKFEYAIGHWLQKAAEHVFGCVLCSPGCFSLFRGSALMDTNVMKKYTTEPTEATHHLQYDQGEDRWLCTLMLQQGYRIEYAAAADAWTFAPEGFNEFFNQRRRWMPSTIANILDLLGSASLTTKKNPNMSILYIAYQWLLMLMTILGPGTILMMIAGAVKLVFKFTLVEAYLFATIPAGIFTLSCFWLKSKYQLIFAAVLSVVYTFVMMIVLVGTIYTATTEDIFHPSVIVIVVLMSIFIVSGICHPKETFCLVHGVMYLLTIPSGYLLLVIYSICNLNDVSWGTREVPTKAQRLEMEKKKQEKEAAKANQKGFWGRIFNRGEEHIRELTSLIKTLIPERAHTSTQKDGAQGAAAAVMFGHTDNQVVEILSKIENNLDQLLKKKAIDDDDESLTGIVTEQPHRKSSMREHRSSVRPEKQESVGASSKPGPSQPEEEEKPLRSALKKEKKKKQKKAIVRDELVNPLWAESKGLGNGVTIRGNKREMEFWKDFVTKYLLPIYPTPEEKKKIADGLRDLRNSSSFGMIIINLLWMALNFMFQYTNAARFQIYYDQDKKIEESVLGMSFIFLLLTLLLIQMFGMFIHRMGTLQHLLAITEVRIGKNKNRRTSNEKRDREAAIRRIKEVLKLPTTDDAGAVTEPPKIADPNNNWGVTVAHRSSMGEGTNGALQGELGKTLSRFGPLMDAQRSNRQLDLKTETVLKSVRQRLTSGTVLRRMEDGELSRSFRPLLPPRPSKYQPRLLQPNRWGFTQRELKAASLDAADDENSRELDNVGAMGRTLFQRTRIINEATSGIDTVPHDLWADEDVARNHQQRSPSRYHRRSNHNHISHM